MAKQFKPENKAFLQEYWQKWLEFKGSGTVSQLDTAVRKRMARIYNEELDEKAILDYMCGSCMADWYKILYNHLEQSIEAESQPIIAVAASKLIDHPAGDVRPNQGKKAPKTVK